ncbi:MAG: hypothetical protein DWQ01_14720 [Planctomycetota bacterium]|nr:MAG: hypothetical protein DWQ01_14720 [Planctomycetota bacterium]
MNRESWRRPSFSIGVGLAAGLLSGLLGIGGGLVLGPALILAGVPLKKALGTSLVVVAPVAAVGVLAELFTQANHLVWWAAALVVLGGQFGAVLGAGLMKKLPERTVRTVFVALLVFTALRNFGVFGALPEEGLYPALAGESWLSRGGATILLGVIGGITASLFGVGGGVVVVPGLVYVTGGIPFHFAAGTSLLAMVPTAARAALLAARQGRVQMEVARVLAPAAVAAAGVGVVIRNLWVRPSLLAIMFGIFLIFVSVQLSLRPAAKS